VLPYELPDDSRKFGCGSRALDPGNPSFSQVILEMITEDLGRESVDRSPRSRDGPHNILAPSLFNERTLNGLNLSSHPSDPRDELLLVPHRVHADKEYPGGYLVSSHAAVHPFNTNQAGRRGLALLEDFIRREKITHFDHLSVSAIS
jgi:hypothetical protein